MSALLEVKDFTMHFTTLEGDVNAVDKVSFQLNKGESIGFAGESGCGKTSLGLSILRLLPSNAKILGGSIFFDGLDILNKSEEELRQEIRWKRMAMVFQGSMNAFCPVHRIGDQIAEAIMLHQDVDRGQANKRVQEVLSLVGIDPSRANNYPHEFSGGMRQRAMIAMALACNPDFVIADEPTTALDVIVQAQILKLLVELREKLGLSFMLISHDISTIADICEKTAIMYAGKIVELADTLTIFRDPKHPYAKGLISAFPSIKGTKKRLSSIPGFPPNLLNPPSGCRFHPRCPLVMDICRQKEPEMRDSGKGHSVACYAAP
jgi:peptide/nickel transport system ATP-binding protein